MNEHKAYKKLNINKLIMTMKKQSLFDSWGIFRKNTNIKKKKDIKYWYWICIYGGGI